MEFLGCGARFGTKLRNRTWQTTWPSRGPPKSNYRLDQQVDDNPSRPTRDPWIRKSQQNHHFNTRTNDNKRWTRSMSGKAGDMRNHVLRTMYELRLIFLGVLLGGRKIFHTRYHFRFIWDRQDSPSDVSKHVWAWRALRKTSDFWASTWDITVMPLVKQFTWSSSYWLARPVLLPWKTSAQLVIRQYITTMLTFEYINTKTIVTDQSVLRHTT